MTANFGERKVDVVKKVEDPPEDVLCGTGFSVAEYPSRIFTSSRMIQQVQPSSLDPTEGSIFTPFCTVVIPMPLYNSLSDDVKENPTVEALTQAGGFTASAYQSLAPPVQDMAERCLLQCLGLEKATELGLLGFDIAALVVDSDIPLRGFQVETEEVTVEAMDGKTAAVVGLFDDNLAYFTVGPVKDGTSTLFPGSPSDSPPLAWQISTDDGWSSVEDLSELDTLSGGPMLIPPQEEDGETLQCAPPP